MQSGPKDGLGMIFRSSDQTNSSTDADVVIEIGAPSTPTAPEQEEPPVTPLEADPFRGFKRRMERARGLFEEHDLSPANAHEDDLRLQVMLLQEENARLKAARHKPADPGSLIEEVRTLRESSQANEVLDEAWNVLGECLALREGLDRACIEVQAAMAAVRERLSTLGVSIENIAGENGTKRGDQESLSA
jgi:hypothetical protein